MTEIKRIKDSARVRAMQGVERVISAVGCGFVDEGEVKQGVSEMKGAFRELAELMGDELVDAVVCRVEEGCEAEWDIETTEELFEACCDGEGVVFDAATDAIIRKVFEDEDIREIATYV